MPLMASLFLMQRICRRPLIQLQWDLKNYNCRNISIEITKIFFVNFKDSKCLNYVGFETLRNKEHLQKSSIKSTCSGKLKLFGVLAASNVVIWVRRFFTEITAFLALGRKMVEDLWKEMRYSLLYCLWFWAFCSWLSQ